MRTNNTDDLALLEEMLQQNPTAYLKQEPKSLPDNYFDFSGMYDWVQDDQVYVKIDDDVVFINVRSPKADCSVSVALLCYMIVAIHEAEHAVEQLMH